MIKTNELRVGNRLWPSRVIDPENIPLLGYKICAGHIAYSDQQLNLDWEPIPLTEERLESMGISTMKDMPAKLTIAQRSFNLYKNLMRDASGRYKGYSLCMKTENGSTAHIFIYYVHQLQNIYFALTGEELTIKEKI